MIEICHFMGDIFFNKNLCQCNLLIQIYILNGIQ